MKQLEVSILGQVYMLGCPEGGETLLSAAVASVDKEMTTIRDSGKVRARERIAVLAALNLAYQLAERGAAPSPVMAAEAAPAETPSETAAALDALLRRVDAALAEDGQLL
jgi:cell division protein ZapA